MNTVATSLLSPIGLATLFVLAALASGRRAPRLAWLLGLCGLAIIWVGATPVASRALADVLKRQYPPVPAINILPADAIVVLGGATESAFPPRTDVELGQAADRLMLAAELYNAGKAPIVLVSGGTTDPGGTPEAEQMRIILMRMGVDAADIQMEARSQDTGQNAHNSMEMANRAGWKHLLLVTSAIHMPRALAAFRHSGAHDIVPVSTDVISASPRDFRLRDWLPEAGALADTSRVIKEMVGYCYYRVRGWI